MWSFFKQQTDGGSGVKFLRNVIFTETAVLCLRGGMSEHELGFLIADGWAKTAAVEANAGEGLAKAVLRRKPAEHLWGS